MAIQKGTIVKLHHLRRGGIIKDDDGREHPFTADDVLLRSQFAELQPGVRVAFEVNRSGRAIHVEIVRD